jgi:hypothetical protein
LFRLSEENKAQLNWNSMKQYDGDCPFDLEDVKSMEIDVDGPDILKDVADTPCPLQQIEELYNMDWEVNGEMEEPIKHSKKTRVLNADSFQCTPTKAFLRYAPLIFWKQVWQNFKNVV